MHGDFHVGDNVYLIVRPRKCSLKRGSCSKLSPKYCGSFEVLERIGSVTYIIVFPNNTKDHNAFPIYFLRKYVYDPNYMIDWYVIQVETEGEFQTKFL